MALALIAGHSVTSYRGVPEGCYRDGPYDDVCAVEYALVEVALRNTNMHKKVMYWGKKQCTYCRQQLLCVEMARRSAPEWALVVESTDFNIANRGLM